MPVRLAAPPLLLLTALAWPYPVLAADLVDPLQPPRLAAPHKATGTAARPAATPSWTLAATLITPTRRSAVIDGIPVAVGTRIRDARVVAIEPFAVVLDRAGRREVLHLVAPSLKRPSGLAP